MKYVILYIFLLSLNYFVEGSLLRTTEEECIKDKLLLEDMLTGRFKRTSICPSTKHTYNDQNKKPPLKHVTKKITTAEYSQPDTQTEVTQNEEFEPPEAQTTVTQNEEFEQPEAQTTVTQNNEFSDDLVSLIKSEEVLNLLTTPHPSKEFSDLINFTQSKEYFDALLTVVKSQEVDGLLTTEKQSDLTDQNEVSDYTIIHELITTTIPTTFDYVDFLISATPNQSKNPYTSSKEHTNFQFTTAPSKEQNEFNILTENKVYTDIEITTYNKTSDFFNIYTENEVHSDIHITPSQSEKSTDVLNTHTESKEQIAFEITPPESKENTNIQFTPTQNTEHFDSISGTEHKEYPDYQITPNPNTEHTDFDITPTQSQEHTDFEVTPTQNQEHTDYQITPTQSNNWNEQNTANLDSEMEAILNNEDSGFLITDHYSDENLEDTTHIYSQKSTSATYNTKAIENEVPTVSQDILDIHSSTFTQEFDSQTTGTEHTPELQSRRRLGYWSAGLVRLCEMIILKQPKHIQPIMQNMRAVIARMNREHKLEYLKQPMTAVFIKIANLVSDAYPDELQHYARLLGSALNERNTLLSPEVNNIIDMTDDLVSEQEGYHIMQAVNALEGYPTQSYKSSYKLCEALIESFEVPLNLRASSHRHKVVTAANQALKERYPRLQKFIRRHLHTRRKFSTNEIEFNNYKWNKKDNKMIDYKNSFSQHPKSTRRQFLYPYDNQHKYKVKKLVTFYKRQLKETPIKYKNNKIYKKHK